jgi:hypothetical protein
MCGLLIAHVTSEKRPPGMRSLSWSCITPHRARASKGKQADVHQRKSGTHKMIPILILSNRFTTTFELSEQCNNATEQ